MSEIENAEVKNPEMASSEQEVSLENDDSVFEETSGLENGAEFGFQDTGRWLLKVVSGPNNGAEFYMETGKSYVIGNDPHSCDIVLYDTSVSRQHAKLQVTPEDTLLIEDLKSRNGVVIQGAPIEGIYTLSPSVMVTLGTTVFVVYDREGEMHTIISPLLPSIVKGLQEEKKEAPPVDTTSPQPVQEEGPSAPQEPLHAFKKEHKIVLGVAAGLLLMGAYGIYSLFTGTPVEVHTEINAVEELNQALEGYPTVRFSYNKSNNSVLLIGHVATAADKAQLLYHLGDLKFLKSIDDSGLVIDEYVWQELNSVLAKNPAWRGVSIHAPSAGDFVLSGYLQSRKQAEQLSDYLSLNFPYIDLLKKNIVVEEEVLSRVHVWIHDSGLSGITAKMANGEVTLSGAIASEQEEALTHLVDQIKTLSGVRIVNNLVKVQVHESGMINISARYEVTGQSKLGDMYSVVINGKFYSEGMLLDDMKIVKISPTMILLEKDGVKYRIDYRR